MKRLTLVAAALSVVAVSCLTTTKTVSTSSGVVVLKQPDDAGTLASGATLHGKLGAALSGSSRVGERLAVTLTEPVTAKHGGVAVPAGAVAYGHVVAVAAGVEVTFDSLVIAGNAHVLDANVIGVDVVGIGVQPVAAGSATVPPSTLLTFGSGSLPAGSGVTLVVLSGTRLKS